MQPFEYRSVRYWSKEINGTRTGGRKTKFFNSRPTSRPGRGRPHRSTRSRTRPRVPSTRTRSRTLDRGNCWATLRSRWRRSWPRVSSRRRRAPANSRSPRSCPRTCAQKLTTRCPKGFARRERKRRIHGRETSFIFARHSSPKTKFPPRPLFSRFQSPDEIRSRRIDIFYM